MTKSYRHVYKNVRAMIVSAPTSMVISVSAVFFSFLERKRGSSIGTELTKEATAYGTSTVFL